jgi:ferredoxin
VFDVLSRATAPDWQRALDAIAPDIHPIDRDATRIWFAFFPLELHQALERATGPDAGRALVQQLRLMGTWRLAEQIDTSHRFLYAHRYWPQVKNAISAHPAGPGATLVDLIRSVAESAARTARVDPDMLLGISAVGLMTLRQVGGEALAAAPGRVHLSDAVRARSPHQVMKRREKNDSQGPFGFLRGIRKQWTVTFDENDPAATFTAIDGQEVATAAREDPGDHRSRDRRCIPGEGPIPVECRAGSCGTCWVGILAGRDRLSPVVERDERLRMQVFGYLDSREPQPLLRLACQAKARGAVTVVIPPWNGFIAGVRESKPGP